jgi:hypothetical protein
MAAGGLATLVRLDLANGRAFLRGAGRDPIFIGAAAIALAAVVFGFRKLLALPADPQLRQQVVTLGFAYLVTSFYAWNSQGHLQRLTAGPFQPLVAGPRPQAVWLTCRSVAFTSLILVLAAVAAFTLDVKMALTFLAQALLGLAIGALAVGAIGSVLSLASSGRGHGKRVAEHAGPPQAVLTPTSLMLTWAHLRRRAGPAPIYVLAAILLVLGGAAGGLANHNSGPTVGVAVVMAFCAAAAWLIADVDLTLVRLLAHEPIGVVRMASMLIGPALVVMFGSLAAAFSAGVGFSLALIVTTLIVMAVLLYVLLLVLNGLVLSPPAARVAAMVDISLAAALPLMAGVWGEAWIIGRLFMLILAARRLRWRDL